MVGVDLVEDLVNGFHGRLPLKLPRPAAAQGHEATCNPGHGLYLYSLDIWNKVMYIRKCGWVGLWRQNASQLPGPGPDIDFRCEKRELDKCLASDFVYKLCLVHGGAICI